MHSSRVHFYEFTSTLQKSNITPTTCIVTVGLLSPNVTFHSSMCAGSR